MQLDCRAAVDRLLSGRPATYVHGHMEAHNQGTTETAVECTTLFITTMDALNLKMVAVDNIQLLLQDLLDSLNKIPTLPASYEGKQKINAWLSTLARMRASDELDEDQVRQMHFDLESAFNSFTKSFKSR
jgi:ESCRT-I complex subunit VPS28